MELQVAKDIAFSSKLIENSDYTYWAQLQPYNIDIHEFFLWQQIFYLKFIQAYSRKLFML